MHTGTGRVDLDRLCDSPVTAAFLEVGTVGQQQVLSLLGYKHDYTTHLRLRESWFAPDSARRVYDHYLELDVDRNGMLTKQELRMFQGLTIDPPRCFTKAFIDRFFEEVETHRVPSADEHGVMSSEIDYNAYLDFTLAIECMQSPEALRYGEGRPAMFNLWSSKCYDEILNFLVTCFIPNVIQISMAYPGY